MEITPVFPLSLVPSGDLERVVNGYDVNMNAAPVVQVMFYGVFFRHRDYFTIRRASDCGLEKRHIVPHDRREGAFIMLVICTVIF